MNEVKAKEQVVNKAHKKRKKNKNKMALANTPSDDNSQLVSETQNPETRATKKKKKKKSKKPSSSPKASLIPTEIDKNEDKSSEARTMGTESEMHLPYQQSNQIGKVCCNLSPNEHEKKMSATPGPVPLINNDASSSGRNNLDGEFVISRCPYFTDHLFSHSFSMQQSKNDKIFRPFKENPELLEAFLQNYHPSQCTAQAESIGVFKDTDHSISTHSTEQKELSMLANVKEEIKNSEAMMSSMAEHHDAIKRSPELTERITSEKVLDPEASNISPDQLGLSKESIVNQSKDASATTLVALNVSEVDFSSQDDSPIPALLEPRVESSTSIPPEVASPFGEVEHSLGRSETIALPSLEHTLIETGFPKESCQPSAGELSLFTTPKTLDFQKEILKEENLSTKEDGSPADKQFPLSSSFDILAQKDDQPAHQAANAEDATKGPPPPLSNEVDKDALKEMTSAESSDLTKLHKSILHGSVSNGAAKSKVEKSVTFKLDPETNSTASTEDMPDADTKTKAQLKAERKAAFEAERVATLKEKDQESPAKSKSELRALRRAKQEAQREAKMGKKGGPEPSLQVTSQSNSVSKQTIGHKENSISTSQTESLPHGMEQTKLQRNLEKSQLTQVSKPPLSNQAGQSPPPEGFPPRSGEYLTQVNGPNEEGLEEKLSTSSKTLIQSTLPVYHAPDVTYALPAPFVQRFSHLTRDVDCLAFASDLRNSISAGIPIYVQRLGLKLAQRQVYGTTARCVSTLACLQKAVDEYETPKNQQLSRDLEAQIKKFADYLNRCRPHSPSTDAVIKDIRQKIIKISPILTDLEAKKAIADEIEKFASVEIDLAMQSVVPKIVSMIKNGSRILTYLWSSLLREAFIEAHKGGVKFQVSIVDSGSHYEGRDLVKELTQAGVECVLLSGPAALETLRSTCITHIMLGVCALHSDGALLTRAGTANLCLAARHSPRRIPIMACCLSFKISDAGFLNSTGRNELGITDELKTSTPDSIYQHHLNLQYDIVPMNLFDMVATEKGVHPCSSVPFLSSRKQDTR